MADLVSAALGKLAGILWASELGSLTGSSSGASPGNSYANATTTSEVIEATPQHPFWVAGKGWIDAGQLQVGDQLLTKDDHLISVLATQLVKKPAQVYNFEVDQLHTYFVGQQQWLVHNAGPCSPRIDRDEEGRVTDVYTRLDLKHRGTIAEKEAQEWAQSFGYGDDAGHAISSEYGGPGDLASGNIFAQNPFLNRGIDGKSEWRSLEKKILNRLIRGDKISLWIQLRYPGPGIGRPSEIMFGYTINGVFDAKIFPNPIGRY